MIGEEIDELLARIKRQANIYEHTSKADDLAALYQLVDRTSVAYHAEIKEQRDAVEELRIMRAELRALKQKATRLERMVAARQKVDDDTARLLLEDVTRYGRREA